MFPDDNWLLFLLGLVILAVVFFGLKLLMSTHADEDDSLDYSLGIDQEFPEAESRSDDFGTSHNHPNKCS